MASGLEFEFPGVPGLLQASLIPLWEAEPGPPNGGYTVRGYPVFEVYGLHRHIYSSIAQACKSRIGLILIIHNGTMYLFL